MNKRLGYTHAINAGLWLMAKQTEIEQGKWTKAQIMEALANHLKVKGVGESGFANILKSTGIKPQWATSEAKKTSAGMAKVHSTLKELKDRGDDLEKRISETEEHLTKTLVQINEIQKQLADLVKELKG